MNMEAVQYNIDFNNMTDDQIKQWGKNIVKDNVVLVRNQNLDEAGILRVCELIGNVLKPDQFFMHPDYPGLFRLTNERRDGEKIGIFADKELDWHSNGNGRKSGKECCVALYCVRPGENSVTSFCDTRQAYRDLSEEDREFYKQIDCTYKFENGTFYDLDEDDKELKKGKILGKGILTLSDGRKYFGKWNSGVSSDKGFVIKPDGFKLDGELNNSPS